MRRPSLTEREKEIIAEKREQRGWSHQRIARHLRRSVGSVQWYCLQVGIEKPDAKPMKPPAPPVVYKRGRYMVRHFTEAEDARLLALAAQGCGDSEIGRSIGRRPNSVRGRLLTIARREERELS